MSRTDPFAARIAAVLLVALAASRVVPHAWNFTPLVAIALFGGARLERTSSGIALTLGALAASDLVLGNFPYAGMAWVYGAVVAIVVLGRTLRGRGVAAAFAAALAGGALFFVVTNFGVWLAGELYARTAAGLVACYVAAVPFYRAQIAADAIYTVALFGAHSLAVAIHARRRRAV
jgi:hypothetical protein